MKIDILNLFVHGNCVLVRLGVDTGRRTANTDAHFNEGLFCSFQYIDTLELFDAIV